MGSHDDYVRLPGLRKGQNRVRGDSQLHDKFRLNFHVSVVLYELLQLLGAALADCLAELVIEMRIGNKANRRISPYLYDMLRHHLSPIVLGERQGIAIRPYGEL